VLIILFSGIILALVFSLIVVINANDQGSDTLFLSDKVLIEFQHGRIEADAVWGASLLQKGLSGRQNLESNTGLLLMFPKADSHGIWMKDMLFALDIIWLDNAFKITGLKKNALPTSYPEVYYPDLPSRYALEVSAGTINSLNLRLGDSAEIVWHDPNK